MSAVFDASFAAFFLRGVRTSRADADVRGIDGLTSLRGRDVGNARDRVGALAVGDLLRLVLRRVHDRLDLVQHAGSETASL